MLNNYSHPNFRLWCALALIPIAIVILVYTYYLANY